MGGTPYLQGSEKIPLNTVSISHLNDFPVWGVLSLFWGGGSPLMDHHESHGNALGVFSGKIGCVKKGLPYL